MLDTGYNIDSNPNISLCEDGHKDFTKTGLTDNSGHGTHITNTIVSRLNKNIQYCIIIIKWHDERMAKYYSNNTSRIIFEYLLTLKVDYINYSAGGFDSSADEKRAIQSLLKKKIKIFVAAGNEGHNLDKDCNYFPACYNLNKLYVVGNKDLNGKKVDSSNYGKVVTHWDNGNNIKQLYKKNEYVTMSGTSVATALAISNVINSN